MRSPADARTGADSSGIVTLEWLLIVGAIAGLAASTTLIVQRVVDDTSEIPADPAVRVIDADIAAAFLASEADAAVLSLPYDDALFEDRCETALHAAFADVVLSASWTSPMATIPPDPRDPPELLTHAQCSVAPQSNLGRP